MSLIGLLKHRCTVKRASAVNTNGAVEPSYGTTVATNQRCLIQENRGSLSRGPAGEALEYDATGFFPANANLKPRGGDNAPDQITITSPAALAGTVYLVIHVADTSGQGKLLNAYLKRFAAG
ncbi:MAG: hypothetical protein E6Q97_35545 [Desulfurellales bacterium]|nr:MAG: hypothetical protein E6Q97_35545 [Desulfurellales bacterium]